MDESELLLLSLPEELLENIISRNSYDGISQCRLVCTSFEKIAHRLLNRGFYNVDKLHSVIQKEVKAKLPRRESERRNHPLARHVDILAAIETRLSLLSMTFMKYIDMGLCCFIPGKVLDELFEVLTCVRKICNPPRAHEMLQELRDISSMAMEHFDEHIVPILKSRMPPAIGLPIPKFADSLLLEFEASMSVPAAPSRAHGLRHELQQLRHSQRAASTSMVAMRRELQECKGKMMVQAKKLFEQQKHLTEATCTIAELQKKQADEDEQISNLNRKVADYDLKFADIATRIDRICTVGPVEKLTMEPRAPQLQREVEFGHSPSVRNKCAIGKSRKRQRSSDKGDDHHDERECDKTGVDPKKLSVSNTYTLRQRRTRRRQSNDNDAEGERAANSRCVSQKRAKMSS